VKVELESIDRPDRLPLRAFAHSIRRSSLHAHPEIEILLVLKGTISVRIEGRTLLLESGDLALVNGNEPHLTQDEGGENLVLAVQLDPAIAGKYDPEIEYRRFAFNDAYKAAPDERVFERVREICARLLWETRIKRIGYQLAAESLGLELALLLVRGFESSPAPRDDAETGPDMDAAVFYTRINRVVGFIERRYRERLSLADIARQEGVNMTYLSRFFKEKMGYSFTGFVQFIRLKKSLSALEETDRKIVDIALDYGFPNVKSYNMVFKRAYGKTPIKWRSERRIDTAVATTSGSVEAVASGDAYGALNDEDALSLIRRYLPSA